RQVHVGVGPCRPAPRAIGPVVTAGVGATVVPATFAGVLADGRARAFPDVERAARLLRFSGASRLYMQTASVDERRMEVGRPMLWSARCSSSRSVRRPCDAFVDNDPITANRITGSVPAGIDILM